jgi:hypothetical protein
MLLGVSEQTADCLDEQGLTRSAPLPRKGIELLEVRCAQDDLDLSDTGAAIGYRHGKWDCLGVFRIGHDLIERRRLRKRLTKPRHALDVRFEGLTRHHTGFLERAAGGDATGKVRKVDAEIAVGILPKETDVRGQQLPLSKSHARLPLNALDRADRHVLSGMRNGHDLLGLWMHEMVVAPGRAKVNPSGIAQLPDDRPAVHRGHDVGHRGARQGAHHAKGCA